MMAGGGARPVLARDTMWEYDSKIKWNPMSWGMHSLAFYRQTIFVQ